MISIKLSKGRKFAHSQLKSKLHKTRSAIRFEYMYRAKKTVIFNIVKFFQCKGIFQNVMKIS